MLYVNGMPIAGEFTSNGGYSTIFDLTVCRMTSGGSGVMLSGSSAGGTPPAVPTVSKFLGTSDNRLYEITSLSPYTISAQIGSVFTHTWVGGVDQNPLDGLLYAGAGGSSNVAGHVFSINPTTGVTTDIGATGFGSVSAVAFDTDGTCYIVPGKNDNDNLYTVNLSTMALTLVGTINAAGGVGGGRGLAFHDGTLYFSDNRLFSLNKSTAAATLIGNLPTAGQDLASFGGSLYAVMNFGDLYEVDVADASTVLIGSSGLVWGGIVGAELPA